MSILPTVLPRLRGIWLILFRVVWCAALAVALFSAIGTTWFDTRDASDSISPIWVFTERMDELGVRIFPPVVSKTWVISNPFSREALSSGIRGGEQIVAVNQRPVTRLTSAPTLAHMLSGREGQKTVLRLRSADGSLHDRVLTYRAKNVETWYRGSGLDPKWQFLLRRVGYDLMTLLLLLPAAILFLRRSHDIVAATFSLSLCLITIGSTVEFWTAISAANPYNILADVPYILLLMVGCAFPDGRYWPSWTRFSLIIAPLILVPATLIAGDYSQFSLFTAPGFIAVVAILALRYRRLAPGTERQQFRWVAFGLATGVTVLLLRIPFAMFQYGLKPGPFSPWIDLGGSFVHALGYAIIGAGFGVSLLRYRLYDAESLISRSAALTAATVMLAGLWATSEKALETLLPAIMGQGQETLAGIISAGFAVVLVTSIHGRVRQWIEKRFQRGVYRLKEKLPALLDVLSPRVDTAVLCEKVLSDIVRDVRATKAAILLRGGSNFLIAAQHQVDEFDVRAWLEAQSSAETIEEGSADSIFKVALPLVDTLKNEPIGWLLVGPRPDGTTCNRDERNALAAVAAPIARTLAAVQARENREGRLLAGLAVLEQRLSLLETQLPAFLERA
ncbi:MAG: hypothetical protein HY243_00520 [Proteobacteria bacterium]|nr:hypothetical protein [Pseudomonadota bacterium]